MFPPSGVKGVVLADGVDDVSVVEAGTDDKSVAVVYMDVETVELPIAMAVDVEGSSEVNISVSNSLPVVIDDTKVVAAVASSVEIGTMVVSFVVESDVGIVVDCIGKRFTTSTTATVTEEL